MSYFAKLAARATLAKPSGASLISPNRKAELVDPFAASEQLQDRLASNPVPSSSSPGARAERPGSRRDDETASRSRNVARQRAEDSQPFAPNLKPPVSQPVTKVTAPVEPVVRTVETTSERPSKTRTRKRQRDTDDQPSRDRVVKVKPQSSDSALQISRTEKARPSRDQESKSENQIAETLADLGAEQMRLQHQADMFMHGLLTRRTEVTEERTEVNEPEVLKPSLARDEFPRLQPPKTAAAPEREPEQPSLVIGKLTVEVTPTSPAPAVAAPSSRLVVVRGTRGGRTGIPSGRRFGLGQF